MKFKIDDKQVRAALAQFPDAVFKAVNSSLTNLSFMVIDELESQLTQSIDRPTPFTAGKKLAWYNDLKINQKDRITRRIGMKGKQASYLQFLTKGTTRDTKIIEKRTPDGRLLTPSRFVQLDQYGNVPRAQFTRMVQAAFRKAKRGEYFFLPKQRGKLYPGIYKRTPTDKGEKPVPMFFAHDVGRNYGKRFDFYGIATREINDKAQAAISEAITFRLRKLNGS